MNLREHEPLARHTTLRTGGPARFFVEATTDDDVREALRLANARRRPVFVLGGGSNVLAADDGFDGMVIKLAGRGLRAETTAPDRVEVVAEAGEEWDALVAFAVGQQLYGVENLSLIPGTVGAAVIGNIGAYGCEVQETLLWVEALDMRTGVVRRFERDACAFAYRESFFKTAEGRHFIVLRAAFSLKTAGTPNLRYKDLAEFFSGPRERRPTLLEVREAVMAIRRRKLPDPATVGTAGSFFKNPVLALSEYEDLAGRYPGLPGYRESGQRVKVPLGWILDKVCGLRGVRSGRAGTHAEHALVIVNDGGTAAEVEAFADEIARQVRAATGLALQWEVARLPPRPTALSPAVLAPS